MTLRKNIPLLILAVPIAVIVLWVVAFSVDQAAASGEVARGVTAAGVELSGLSEEDALAELRVYERTLRTTPAPFLVSDQRLNLIPVDIALAIDEEAVVSAAMQQRREDGFFNQLFGWLGTFNDPIALDVEVSYEEDLLEDVFTKWEQLVIARPAYAGSVQIREGRAVPDYPQAGEGIDRPPAEELVVDSVVQVERDMVTLPTVSITPELTESDINQAVEEANRLIGGPITLSSDDPEFVFEFTVEQLINAFTSEMTTNSPLRIEQGFNRDEIAALLLDRKQEIEQEPVSAQFDWNTSAEEITIIPGKNALRLDIDLVMEELLAATNRPSRNGDFPFSTGEEPRFTTEEAQAMGPFTRVSQFTTKHSPGGGNDRVTNIHAFADIVNGAIVWPGDSFSLNEHVGRRTEAKGFVPAGMLINGRLADAVGGGVSQFATTFYNAVFYGGYEDITHKPHSRYFTRYPEVNEATISWPSPDLEFRNNTDAPVFIKTQYTRSSITVKFFGNNGGLDCDRGLGARSSEKVGGTEYRSNAALDPGQQNRVESSTKGWTNTVVRTCKDPSGEIASERRWSWTYSALPAIIEVHPCDMPGSSQACPEKVPSVVGMSFGEATATLEAAGFLIANNGSEETNTAGLDGTVASQSTTGYLASGSTVKVTVYTYVAPPTTTTTTTTTTAPPDEGG
jgi:vancomycin resistance protein YoaR